MPPMPTPADAILYAPTNMVERPRAVAENRCTFRAVSSANYSYVRPARDMVTYLRLMPLKQRGFQRTIEERVQVAPLPHSRPEQIDDWGNRLMEIHHEQVGEHMTLVVELEVETACRYAEDGSPLPTPIPPRIDLREEQRIYKAWTARTQPNTDMERFARVLQEDSPLHEDPFGFAARVRQNVHTEMTFNSNATHVRTSAAEAWENRHGVCQDYAHITITLLRLSGYAARYVSGFVPGEGVMHAWVEVLLPWDDSSAGSRGAAWFALDPTYDKWVTERYITVAVGRDYADATPTSGVYTGGASTIRYGTRMELLREDMVTPIIHL